MLSRRLVDEANVSPREPLLKLDRAYTFTLPSVEVANDHSINRFHLAGPSTEAG